MIFDTIENLKEYSKIIPYFDEIKAYINKNPLNTLPEGKHEIIEGNLFVISSEYITNPEGPLKGELEAHKKYIDLQIMIEGEEKVRMSNIKDLEISQQYNQEKDVAFYKPLFDISEFFIQKGKFAVFFPQDGHEPGGAVNGVPIQVKKAVFKISVLEENSGTEPAIW